MPYKRLGKEIHTKRTGTWKRKQTCTSITNAKSALRILREIESNKITHAMSMLKAKYPKRRNLIHNYQTKMLANPLKQQYLTTKLLQQLRTKPNSIKFKNNINYILVHTGTGVRRYTKKRVSNSKHSKAYIESVTLYKKRRRL